MKRIRSLGTGTMNKISRFFDFDTGFTLVLCALIFAAMAWAEGFGKTSLYFSVLFLSLGMSYLVVELVYACAIRSLSRGIGSGLLLAVGGVVTALFPPNIGRVVIRLTVMFVLFWVVILAIKLAARSRH